MGKVLDISELYMYKSVEEKLSMLHISEVDKKKLMLNPELCREIIPLCDYCISDSFSLSQSSGKK